MEPGETFRDVRVRFGLFIIVEDDEELEDIICKVAGLLADYTIESIELQPEIDGGVLAGARLTITVDTVKEELFNA